MSEIPSGPLPPDPCPHGEDRNSFWVIAGDFFPCPCCRGPVSSLGPRVEGGLCGMCSNNRSRRISALTEKLQWHRQFSKPAFDILGRLIQSSVTDEEGYAHIISDEEGHLFVLDSSTDLVNGEEIMLIESFLKDHD